MEVAISKTPFQQQVHEWQHTHPSPTAESNPINNHWIKGPFNTYGKMVTNNFMTPDGTKHTQKKQMEILHARTTSGSSLQVVRAQTSQTVSSRTLSGTGSSNTVTKALPQINQHGANSIVTNSDQRPERPSSLSLNTMSRPFSNFLLKSNTKFGDSKSPTKENWDGTFEGLLRGKSISNEDLAQHENNDSDIELGQWNRVSRIRRSLQYPSPNSGTSKGSSRPMDFPKQSVDVSKIRLELENICATHKTDKSPTSGEFVALDSILKKAEEEQPKDAPITNGDEVIVTAETLQTVRNRLRRLEDESLYKDDILNSPRNSLTSPTEEPKLSYSTASPSVRTSFGDWRAKLLSKDKDKDINSVIRRKSYGFERLENQNTFDTKMESSTDSGLGLSSDFSSVVSPTNEHRRPLFESNRSKLSPTRITLYSNDAHLISLPKSVNPKRHSISTGLSTGSKLDFDGRTSILINGNTEDDSSSLDGILDETGKRTRRVEFCKTEIHFAPDSGRVNIVETDGKPPPTNNFRRRRRSPGSSHNSTTTGDSYTRFGEKEEIKVVPEVRPISLEPHKSTVDLTTLNNLIDGTDDMSIRGILKNKPIKPKQYHLGENLKDIDSIWGVKLNPIYDELSFSPLRRGDIGSMDPYKHSLSDTDDIPIRDRTRSKENDFGYSTKVDFTFNAKSNHELFMKKEGPTIRKNILPHSQNSSFVEYIKPTSPNSKTNTKVFAPEQELKSISLVKNTIRLGDSPTKFEIIETKIVQPELSEIESQKGTKFEIGTLGSVNRNKTDIINETNSVVSQIGEPVNSFTNSGADQTSELKRMHELKLKQDLDEAFKDLMSVSATLRELGNKQITQTHKNSHNIVIKHNTFPTIKANNAHSISTITARDWNFNAPLKYEVKGNESSAGSDTAESPKKPIPKPRHYFGVADSQVTVADENIFETSSHNQSVVDEGFDTIDICKKNVVKARQMLFESLSQKTIGGSQNTDTNSMLTSPITNKMSIELYSPTNSLSRPEKPIEKKRPVPQPRTILSDSEGVVKPARVSVKSKAFESFPLKSGTRQLKTHELVYFGILANEASMRESQRSKPTLKQNSSPNSPIFARHNAVTNAQRSDVSRTNDYFYKTTFEKQVTPELSPRETISRYLANKSSEDREESNEEEEFTSNTSTIERINKFERVIRENLGIDLNSRSERVSPKIKTRNEMLGYDLKETSVDDVDDFAIKKSSPERRAYKHDKYNKLETSYDRAHDYKRDEQVLDELTKAADEIMNTVKNMDEDESKRKSRSHHHQQHIVEVMETINEKPSFSETRERVIYSPRRISRDCCSSLSSASSVESIPTSRRSPARTPINKIPLRKNSTESVKSQRSITNTSSTQSIKSKSSSNRDCRRLLRTASREALGSSSEDLTAIAVKIEPPRRSRRSKTATEGTSREISTRRGSDSSRTKVEEKTSNRGKVYTHRLRKVDDISIKPSSKKHHSSKTRAVSSTIKSSKTSL